MKNAIKKIMAFVLVIAMIAGVLPSVFAATQYVEPFKDVKADAWYADYVEYVYDRDPQLMNGTTSTTFSPNGTCTRAMAAVVLYRLDDSPAIFKPATFTDLKQDWYKNGIAWAQAEGVVNGVSATKFDPDGLVTREQLVSMLWRYAGEPTVNGDYLNAFSDKNAVSTYARAAFNWAISEGIIGGANGLLNPKGNATRAEFAKILYVFAEKLPVPPTEPTSESTDPTEPTSESTDPTESTEPVGDEIFTLATSIKGGDEVIIYNPGHGMAVRNETDNNWYLVPQTITPENNKIVNPDAVLVWTVIDNGDGSFSFANGENKIVAYLSGTYIELTNDANWADADSKWIVSYTDGLAYLQSSTLSNSYGPAYIECFYNANKDKTNISGYTSSNPAAKSGDFGFQFFVKGDDPVPPTEPTESTEPVGDEIFTLATSIKGGDEVIIYNPGHGMAVRNETDNNWYLVPQTITPENNKIVNPDAVLVWTVIDNGDGTFSFANGENKIVAYLSGTYIELTNDANWADADSKWIVSYTDGLAYLQSSTLSNSYGPAYIECYYNANKDKTNISGYTSSNPAAKSGDFGFQFFVKGGPVDPTDPTDPTDPPVPGTEYALASELKDGDEVVIYNAGNGKAVPATMKGSYYLDGVDVTPSDDVITTDNEAIIWTVSVNADGSYTFTNGTNVLSINWNTDSSKTSVSLDGANAAIALETCNAANSSYYLYSATQTGNYEHIYLEWYAKYTEFSAYDTGAAKLTENDFGFQFYVKGGEPIVPPSPPTGLPIKDGDCVVIYNAANGVIIGFNEDTDYDEDTGDYTYCNITTEDANVDGTDLTAGFNNAGTFYVVDNEDGTFSFLDQYDYDEDESVYCLSAEAPDTYYGDYDEYAAFEIIAVDGGYLLKNVGDDSYYAIEDGVVVAKELVEDDENFIFQFALWEGDGDEETNEIFCTILEGGEPVDPTEPTEPTDPPVPGTEYALASELKDGDLVVIYNAGNGKAVPATMKGSYYLDGVDVTPVNNVISTELANLVWKVTKNADGTYTFSNGSSVLSINWNADSKKTSVSLDGANANIALETCNAANHSYYLYSATQTGNYEHIYLEWYAKYTEFSAYDTGAAKLTEADFGFQFYVKGGEPVTPTEPTTPSSEPTTPSSEPTTPTAPVEGDFVLANEIADGDEVVIYNPGYGKAIKNENDNHWYLIAQDITPANDAIADPDASLVWTVVANDDGTFSFVNGENKIVAWLSGTYVELTNDAAHDGADAKWNVAASATEGLFYISSSSVSTSYGAGYLECYTKSGTVKVCGYASSNPTDKDFGFQFYVKGGEPAPVCEHKNTETRNAKEATCTATGYTGDTYCLDCGKMIAKGSTIPALGHVDANSDNVCDRCNADLSATSSYTVADSIEVGDMIVLVADYNDAHYAMANDTKSISNALAGIEVTVDGDEVVVGENDIVWEVVAGSADGTFTLKNKDGKFISWTSSTTLTLGATGADFTITCGAGTSMIVLTGTVDQSTVRCLAMRDNNGAQFRAYSTKNVGTSGYAATFTIYKLS